jgi:ribosomal protein L40E
LGKGRKRKLAAPKKVPELTQGELIIITESGNSLEQDRAVPTEIIVPTTLEPASDPAGGLRQRTLIQKQRQQKKRYFIKRKNKEASELINYRTCIKCGKSSSNDAKFCQYCGSPFDV